MIDDIEGARPKKEWIVNKNSHENSLTFLCSLKENKAVWM